MKKLYVFLIALLAFSSSFAQSYSRAESETRCNTLGNERATSLNAQDYKGLRSVVKWGIDNCKSFLDRDSYYEQYGDLALAERSLGNFQTAMKAVDECIKNRYGLPHCHIEKVAINIDLRNTKEAIQGAKTFKLIASDAIDKKKKALANSSLRNYERDAIESELSSYEAMLGFANRFLDGQ